MSFFIHYLNLGVEKGSLNGEMPLNGEMSLRGVSLKGETTVQKYQALPHLGAIKVLKMGVFR